MTRRGKKFKNDAHRKAVMASIHQSKRGRTLDRNYNARRTGDQSDDQYVKKWRKHPNRMDVKGIDTISSSKESSRGSKTKVKKIAILRAEGRSTNPDVGKWRYFDSFSEANKFLRKQSVTAPDSGGYDKHDFKVTWEDGKTFEGRLDVKHDGSDTDVGEHIEDHCKYLSTSEFDWLPKEQVADNREYANHILNDHALNDNNQNSDKEKKHKKHHKKPKFVLYGTADGMKKKFGTYDSKEEADTAIGIHGIDLENSGFEGKVKWDIEKKS